MEKSKFNFFKQIQYAVTKPLQYYRLTKVSGGRMTGFVFLFVLITSLFTIIPFLYSMVGPNGATKFLHDKLPAFEFSNGELNVDERFEEKESGTYVLIDTSKDKFSADDIDNLYDESILVSKTNMITYQYGKTQVIDFAQLKGLHFDNSIIDKLMPFLYLIFIFIACIMYVFMVAAYFFTAVLYSLVGLITSAAVHANLTYATIFKTAVYGKVTASIIDALINVLPVNIPGLLISGLEILITCAFVVYGTLSHNSDAAHEEAGINPPPQNPYL